MGRDLQRGSEGTSGSHEACTVGTPADFEDSAGLDVRHLEPFGDNQRLAVAKRQAGNRRPKVGGVLVLPDAPHSRS